MKSDLAVPSESILARINANPSPAERVKLQAESMVRVEDPRFDRPVPKFLTELPFGGDDEEITDRIASSILVADDPDTAQAEAGTDAGRDIVGRKCTIWDLRTLASDKPKGWGVYLILDVTFDGSDEHRVINTGAKQVVTRLANAWAREKLPLTGVFAEIDGTGKKGNAALCFMGEEPF